MQRNCPIMQAEGIDSAGLAREKLYNTLHEDEGWLA